MATLAEGRKAVACSHPLDPKSTQSQPPTFWPLSPSTLCPHQACSSSRAMPLTSLITSFLPVLAHERATSTLFQASAFAFRSFPLLLRLPLAFAPSGNKRHHHHHHHCIVLPMATSETLGTSETGVSVARNCVKRTFDRLDFPDVPVTSATCAL